MQKGIYFRHMSESGLVYSKLVAELHLFACLREFQLNLVALSHLIAPTFQDNPPNPCWTAAGFLYFLCAHRLIRTRIAELLPAWNPEALAIIELYFRTSQQLAM
ncbi:hypothetical protein [Paenibacillus donghaensis]|uniref:Uncharacterized protein n=1 Tax=Paenibacillus donghaensis TaxID=414771 RepID=A0A2Z2K671_9BACL|nr:hypothetical protein [Paenibacillus donghaensis]ASA20224.1 hypothetical protein B9T62_05060 [Paenibacillus donghaensis]